MAQYSSRRGAREAGVRKRAVTCWAFTPEENVMIPNFYEPANGFTERLNYVGVIKAIPNVLGGYEVTAALTPAPSHIARHHDDGSLT